MVVIDGGYYLKLDNSVKDLRIDYEDGRYKKEEIRNKLNRDKNTR